MSKKVGRNDPCPCNSGKKFKKCCINKGVTHAAPKEALKTHPLTDFNQEFLLDWFGTASLLPENHGKNIRLELLIREAILYGKKDSGSTDKAKLQKVLDDHYNHHHLEDPPVNLFTELITYYGEEPREYIATEDYEEWMTRGIPNVGDILFTTEAPLGNVAELTFTHKIALAQRLVTFQPLKNDYISKFLKYYILSPIFQEKLWSKATGTTVKGIKTSVLKKFEIPLPPLPEQQRIVAKLDGLFAKIDQAIGLLEENIAHTQALMGSVLGEIYYDGDTEIKEVCIVGPKKSEVRDLDENLEVSFLPMKDLNEHNINFIPQEIKKNGDVYKGYTYFADGDIILAKVTPCFENGKAGLAKDLINGIGFGSSEYHILRPKETVLPEWIYFAVLTEQFRVTGKENMTGAGGLKRVPRPFLEEWKIPVPELSIQKKQIKRIVQIQEETKNLESSIQEKLNHLKALKSSLLNQAFKGEL